MKSNNFLSSILKLIKSYLLLFILNVCANNNKVKSYLIFPLEYLSDKNYKFKSDNNIDEITPEEVIQKLYYKNLITKIDIGNPSQKISFLLETNKEIFFLSSSNPSTNSTEKGKDSFYYKFAYDESYNELSSSLYKTNKCEVVSHVRYGYSEYCYSNDTLHFNINNTNVDQVFRFKIVKNNDGNVSGCIGLLYNDTYFEYTRGFITELKNATLIDNYYWFFDFDEFSPLEKKLKGQFILGGLPHEIFPNKYSFSDLETTSNEEVWNAGRAWRVRINKIYIENQENKDIIFEDQVMTFNYEIYNIISSFNFRYEIRELIMNELVAQNKCFISNFQQDIYSSNNLTFYYCLKSVKDILYKKIPNIKFFSAKFGYTFEITKEELFYEKGDYIYFNILFATFESNTHWIMGQIFTSKYHFFFNSDLKQIGFYKKVTPNPVIDEVVPNNGISNVLIIILVAIGIALIFLFIGLVLGKKIFGWRRKIIANELTDELDYEYKTKDNDDLKPDDNINSQNTFGINNNENIN